MRRRFVPAILLCVLTFGCKPQAGAPDPERVSTGGRPAATGGAPAGTGGSGSGGMMATGGTTSAPAGTGGAGTGGASTGGAGTGGAGSGGAAPGSGGTTPAEAGTPDVPAGGDAIFDEGDHLPGRPDLRICKKEWTPEQCCAFLCRCLTHLCSDSPKGRPGIATCMNWCPRISDTARRCHVYHCYVSISPTGGIRDHDSHCGHAADQVPGGGCPAEVTK